MRVIPCNPSLHRRRRERLATDPCAVTLRGVGPKTTKEQLRLSLEKLCAAPDAERPDAAVPEAAGGAEPEAAEEASEQQAAVFDVTFGFGAKAGGSKPVLPHESTLEYP